MGLPQVWEARDQRLDAARRQFFIEGAEPEGAVSEAILRSWQRCRRSGLDPAGGLGIDAAARVRLSESRERNACLLEQASGVMEHVFKQIRASGSMVILADIDGMIIHSLGDASFVDRAERVALQPGACWSEEVRGTNGIGTAAVEGAPLEVFGSEHYFSRYGFLTCSASPIFDPRGKAVGVFDISGDYRGFQSHTLGLVRLSVQLLERRLFEVEFQNEILVAFHPRPEYLGTLQEGLIAISPDGWILGANPVAREWFAETGASPAQSFASLFKLSLGAIFDRAIASPRALLKLDLRHGGVLYVQARGLSPRALKNGFVAEAEVVTRPEAIARPAVALKPRDVAQSTLDALATGDPTLQRAIDRAKRIAGKDIPLLIQGESGVGKELFARAFHNSGPRAAGPFVALNCAAIPETLIESELFGYVGGAFTGARREGAIGKIQQAHGGTLFLDEIGDMPLGMQARLLRVLQERSVVPIGGLKATPVDVSLICATHRMLADAITKGEFREDLYYRVDGLTVTLPPLRERTDIRTLVSRILAAEIDPERHGEVVVSEAVMRFFARHAWPGNIRQLHNVIRLSLALMDDDESEILPDHLPEGLFVGDGAIDTEAHPGASEAQQAQSADAPGGATANVRSLEEIELELMAAAIREVGGNVSEAARRLGVSRNTLYRKLGRRVTAR
jgi:transcriptional regulator of acetoin/glycerol metabolism